jgi:hypothetical protein
VYKKFANLFIYTATGGTDNNYQGGNKNPTRITALTDLPKRTQRAE